MTTFLHSFVLTRYGEALGPKFLLPLLGQTIRYIQYMGAYIHIYYLLVYY